MKRKILLSIFAFAVMLVVGMFTPVGTDTVSARCGTCRSTGQVLGCHNCAGATIPPGRECAICGRSNFSPGRAEWINCPTCWPARTAPTPTPTPEPTPTPPRSMPVPVSRPGTTLEITIDNPTARVNGENVRLDQSAVILNGRTVAPMRFIAESLGAEVAWDSSASSATITKGDTVIEVGLDNPIAHVNGESVTLEQSAVSINGRTLVPARFIAENLNATVAWDASAQRLTIVGGDGIPGDQRIGTTIELGGHEWLVLDTDGDYALVLSEHALFQMAYHNTTEVVTWETSDIRQYLNSDFFESLPDELRGLIRETNVINSDSEQHGTPGGNDTTDKIFLLSRDEAIMYFGEDTREYHHNRVAKNAEGDRRIWWLRSPGRNNIYVEFVSFDGAFHGGGNIASSDIFFNVHPMYIRPAFWVYIDG